MLFLIFVLILAIGIGVYGLEQYEKKHRPKTVKYYYDDNDKNVVKYKNEHPFLYYVFKHNIDNFYFPFITIGAILVCISLVLITLNYMNAKSYEYKGHVQYESLCYKLESDKARDEFGLLNKEIVDEIQEWNENISYYQNIQDSFWFGPFYPNAYDDFELIKLE